MKKDKARMAAERHAACHINDRSDPGNHKNTTDPLSIDEKEQGLIEDHPQKLIEDHPQAMIEDHYPKTASGAAPFVAAAAKKSGFGWLGWCAAALIAAAVIFCAIYFGTRRADSVESTPGTAFVKKTINKTFIKSVPSANTTDSSVDGSVSSVNDTESSSDISDNSGNVSSIATANGLTPSGKKVIKVRKAAEIEEEVVENFVYYFANDASSIPDNRMLDALAREAVEHNAEISITGYASEVGNPAYNEMISKKRAENMAQYLIAQGVSKDHIAIEADGATDSFGDAAHCRRVEIHMEYDG